MTDRVHEFKIESRSVQCHETDGHRLWRCECAYFPTSSAHWGRTQKASAGMSRSPSRWRSETARSPLRTAATAVTRFDSRMRRTAAHRKNKQLRSVGLSAVE